MTVLRAVFVFCVSLSLLACSTSPFMDDYLDTIVPQESYIYFKHPEYGLLGNQQAPLASEFIACNQRVMGGASVQLGENSIRDISVLERVNQDYHAFLLDLVVLTGKESREAFAALYRKTGVNAHDAELRSNAFAYTEGIELPLKRLTRQILKRNKCLAQSGWLYKRINF